MCRILIFAFLLTLANPALATGQEMAGLAVYLAAAVSLIGGLALGTVIVMILLLVTWLRGTLRQRPMRVAVASVIIMVASPFAVLLGYVAYSTIEDMRKYPAKYTWFTGVGVQPVEQTTLTTPAEPAKVVESTNILERARDGLYNLALNVVYTLRRDPEMEEAEQRASQPGGK